MIESHSQGPEPKSRLEVLRDREESNVTVAQGAGEGAGREGWKDR